MRTLTVICPVYEEEESIRAFHEELTEVLETVSDNYSSTILYVVDPGGDDTLQILKRIATRDERVQVLFLSARFGHQMSLIAGMDHADADAVIMLDSDLQHPPSLIPQMLQEFENGYDVVYTLREDSSEISPFKRSASRLFYRMINRISDVPINENAADFRLISRRVLEVFKQGIREKNQFIRGLVGWVGFKKKGIRFKVRKRAAGKSKYSVARMVRFGVDGVVSFSKSPLVAATFVGFAFAGFGFVFAIVTTVQYFIYSSFPSGWATLVILLSIFSGTQLIFLGIIGQYIGAIFDEVKNRPHYIVQESINMRAEKSPEMIALHASLEPDK